MGQRDGDRVERHRLESEDGPQNSEHHADGHDEDGSKDRSRREAAAHGDRQGERRQERQKRLLGENGECHQEGDACHPRKTQPPSRCKQCSRCHHAREPGIPESRRIDVDLEAGVRKGLARRADEHSHAEEQQRHPIRAMHRLFTGRPAAANAALKTDQRDRSKKVELAEKPRDDHGDVGARRDHRREIHDRPLTPSRFLYQHS